VKETTLLAAGWEVAVPDSTEGTSLGTAVALLEAIEHYQLFCQYQAVFDLRRRAVCGVEALIRWDHPRHGVLGPADFLPPDMSGGLGGALTCYVLDQAIGQCAAWQAAGIDVPVAVNVSPGRLVDDLVPARVAALLADRGVAPDRLTVEVTEQRCGVDPDAIRHSLTTLARLGVRLSLDDFGIGESTLSRLQQLHFDEVKIDRSFVRDMGHEPTDRNIVSFASQLAHSLGMQVVAEGVESAEALALLTAMGVDRAQGFHLHRPAPAEEVTLLLDAARHPLSA
jgi:EAL domain-containing protein (putative c-di-GMP-specific phosphodiesterase class I)